MKILLLLTAGVLFSPHNETPGHKLDEHQTDDPKTEWVDIETAQELSKEDGHPVFLFFEAEWCGTCKRMLRTVFPQPEVDRLLSENYHAVSIDLDSRKEILFNGQKLTKRSLARELEIEATPTLLFLNSAGEELGRFLGFLDEDDFKRLLVYVTSDQFNEVSFEDFTLPGQ
jgi:thioredoxin-related protein